MDSMMINVAANCSISYSVPLIDNPSTFLEQ